MCFDYGFGLFCWVCILGKLEDFDKIDVIVVDVLNKIMVELFEEI